jgi:hypothetical protein
MSMRWARKLASARAAMKFARVNYRFFELAVDIEVKVMSHGL